jgi:hypothetical protein
MKPRLSPTQIRYGHFESHPAIFTNDEAWVFFDTWRELGASEVLFHAGLMTRAGFELTYGPLPALPERAFTT